MPRRDVTDELRRDVLVDVPKGQERRFGTGGGPFPNPPPQAGKGRQSEALSGGGQRRRLARRYRADTTCPFMTKRARTEFRQRLRPAAGARHSHAEREGLSLGGARGPDALRRRP